MFGKIAYIVITESEADQIPECGAVAKTPDGYDIYVDVDTAKDLEVDEDVTALDQIKNISPKVQEALDGKADIIKFSY